MPLSLRPASAALVPGAAFLILAACSGDDGGGDPVLTGRWDARFTLEQRGKLDPPPTGSEVRGTIRVRGTRGPTIDRYETWRGSYDADFTPFFGQPRPNVYSSSYLGDEYGDPETGVLASRYGGDSVLIVLSPALSHGGFALRGTARGDTVRGRWEGITGHGGEPAGTFELRRRR